MTTLQHLLDVSVSYHPDKRAVVIPEDCELTYSQFSKEVERVKQILSQQGRKVLED